MKVTLEEMQAFVVVVDCGSVTAAAGQLGQTTSGISRALGRLESKLGMTLLHRTTRRLALSEEGQIFLQHARDVLQTVELAEEQIALRRRKPSGRLRINAAASFMQHVIVPLIPEFRRRYPCISLELNTDDVIIDLLEQHTDVAIRIGELRDSSIHARPLGATRLRILASPEYLSRHGTPLGVEALAGHTLLGFTQSESLNLWPLRSAFGDYYPIVPTIAASNGEMLRQLALRGEGIVRLSDFMTRDDVAAGRLVQILADDTLEMRLPVNAVFYRNTALASRIVSFLDFLSEKMAQHPL
ncbi:LysR family transcriptional regulator [Dickeya dadantii]|uniref:Transcriptional regulator, LysR family n=1 Tax=Dickeya dadantii (strain 3937) TaxID=198628 RepID=E0SI56_DICD3|nr:LysR family transcriptional regulator [Dickeya dadantii]ADM96570.1 Transcriptional regulator, LysR family [Dickeya dadantii 3937]NAT76408.1 LysR family transcriptional regulator [Dickeya dadantii]NPE51540.1 LysR family transcriptional regulator [Dickeya dadantii]NPE55312.1 LysR family transcriptional regulator [Dickeya dadantii]NPE62768.1 LysR family transcriptional regulator [Dickeya dadantii]